GIVGKYPDLPALLAQALKQLRQAGIAVADEVAQRSLLEPLPRCRSHPLLAAAHERSGSRGQLALEVLVELIAELLPDTAVGTQYGNEIDALAPDGGEQHFPQHAKAQAALVVQRAIDVEDDQPDIVPIQCAVDRARAHCRVMYC